MRLLNHKLCLLVMTLIMISCSYQEEIARINTGGMRNDTVVVIRKELNSTDGETLLNYSKDGVQRSDESNTIKFAVTQKKKVKTKFEAPTIYFNKDKYAYATINKYFYKKKPWRPFFAVVGIAALVPTMGTSLSVVISNWRSYELKTYESEKIKTENINYKGLYYNKKILLEVNVFCKNDFLSDTLLVTETLPIGVTLNSFKVKTKKGKIDNVDHKKYIKNGVEHHEYRILGRSNVFKKKKTKIWILEDVTISGLEDYKIN